MINCAMRTGGARILQQRPRPRMFTSSWRGSNHSRGISTQELSQRLTPLIIKGNELVGIAIKGAILAIRVSYEFGKLVASKQYFMIPDVKQATMGLCNFYTALKDGTWRAVPIKDSASYLFEGVKILGFFTIGEMIGRGSIIGYHIPGADNRIDKPGHGH